MKTVAVDAVGQDARRILDALLHEPSAKIRDLAGRRSIHAIAVLIPVSGPTGLFGPSSIAAAQLAMEEINARHGIGGHELAAVFLDSYAGRQLELGREVDALIRSGAINAVVSLSFSEVREHLNSVIANRVPHVFTPPYDGNERSPNVFTIGGTPTEQLVPAIHRISDLLHVKRWALIGKNNVWPHPSAYLARGTILRSGGSIVRESYILPGRLDAAVEVEQIAKAKPDIVFSSLVGQDAIEFNRTFCAAGLDRSIFRFTEMAEENTLLGSGAKGTNGMFTVASYFGTLTSDINLSFHERYHSMHGAAAPPMNMAGQSIYEGIQFYGSLVEQRRRGLRGPIIYPTARGGVFHSNWQKEDPIYLAEADGLQFQVLEELVC